MPLGPWPGITAGFQRFARARDEPRPKPTETQILAPGSGRAASIDNARGTRAAALPIVSPGHRPRAGGVVDEALSRSLLAELAAVHRIRESPCRAAGKSLASSGLE